MTTSVLYVIVENFIIKLPNNWGGGTESCHVIAKCSNVAVSLSFYLTTYAIHFINNYITVRNNLYE